MLPITKMIVKEGSTCRLAHPLTPKYITIHETGNFSKGAGALNHGQFLLKSTGITSWHYTVDDVAIVQHIPDDENAWHAGDGTNGTGNRESIAIEICVNPDSNFVNAVINAGELVFYLMNKYNIPLENVVQHNHWNGKNCPATLRTGSPLSWNNFMNLIKSLEPDVIKAYTIQLGYYSFKENAQNLVNTLAKKGIDATIVEKED